ncbi:MAG: hypothetical protein ACE5GB_13325, partial [Acidimicrobiales bacterium]
MTGPSVGDGGAPTDSAACGVRRIRPALVTDASSGAVDRLVDPDAAGSRGALAAGSGRAGAEETTGERGAAMP